MSVYPPLAEIVADVPAWQRGLAAERAQLLAQFPGISARDIPAKDLAISGRLCIALGQAFIAAELPELLTNADAVAALHEYCPVHLRLQAIAPNITGPGIDSRPDVPELRTPNFQPGVQKFWYAVLMRTDGQDPVEAREAEFRATLEELSQLLPEGVARRVAVSPVASGSIGFGPE